MGLAVYWTAFAEERLKDIFDYYDVTANRSVADGVVNELIEKSMLLEKNPRMGQRESLLSHRPQEFRYLVCNHHKIIYWIDKLHGCVYVAHAFVCRQNPTKMMEV